MRWITWVWKHDKILMVVCVCLYTKINNLFTFEYAHWESFVTTFRAFLHIFLISTTTKMYTQWMKEEKNLFLVYICDCVAFLFNIIFFSLFLEHFSVFYLLHSSVQLVVQFRHAFASRFRDLWEISFNFFVLIIFLQV